MLIRPCLPRYPLIFMWQAVTIHSAVSFLDELMMKQNFNTKDWHLNAVCCLSVAGKHRKTINDSVCIYNTKSIEFLLFIAPRLTLCFKTTWSTCQCRKDVHRNAHGRVTISRFKWDVGCQTALDKSDNPFLGNAWTVAWNRIGSNTAKYEEAECNMPMISELADATEMSLTTSIVTSGELYLVQKWDPPKLYPVIPIVSDAIIFLTFSALLFSC